MAEAQSTGPGAGKLVIRNIGLLLSGDLENPILDADTLIAVDGKITAIGKAKDWTPRRRPRSSTPRARRSPPA